MFLFFILALCFVSSCAFNVGIGIYDTTGPSTEINFMGYAVPGQRGTGIHLRLRSRAFIIESSHEDDERIAYVSVDGGMSSDLVKTKVLEKVADAVGAGIYTEKNVAISGTHSHSGPGGFLQYVLYQSTSLGYVEETFDAIVEGVAQSIISAHEKLEPIKISINQGTLSDDSNINRSPTSYLLNPEEERNQYPDGDTDKTMTLLKFSRQNKDGSEDVDIGILNWFAVHATSMNNTNTLVSGDNKGYASALLEKSFNGPSSQAGHGPFVAAFASSNLGDVSPNTRGAKCIDTGLACDGTTSTCNGRCEKCIAFGPGVAGDMVMSTQIIGEKQAKFAKGLMDSAKEEIEDIPGSVKSAHSFVKFTELNVTISGAEGDDTVQLCSPAMGYAFAAGTTDGPGMFGFEQHTTTGNPFWNHVRDFLSPPTEAEIACQFPKPILLNTGNMDRPYEWDPSTIALQIFRVGNMFIVSVPSELTTMAGRRVRAAVSEIVQPLLNSGETAHVAISGLTNGYSSYVSTFEEFQAQRYEAASTIYGPHTLSGYIQELSRIAKDLVTGAQSKTSSPPPNNQDSMIQMMPLAHPDRVPLHAKFGEVIKGTDVKTDTPYTIPMEPEKNQISELNTVVTVQFHSANPRHNQRAQGTYLTVERENDGEWEIVRTDGDWDTHFNWICGKDDKLHFGFSHLSRSVVTWDLTQAQQELLRVSSLAQTVVPSLDGQYRICYFGDAMKEISKKIVPFTGCSSTFSVKVK